MNPIKRSALAIAATCGVVAVAPVVQAAPLTVADASDPAAADAVPPALSATDTPGAECAPPPDSAPVTTTVPTDPTDPTVTTTTVPETTTTTTVPDTTTTTTTTVPAPAAGLVTPVDPETLDSVPPTTLPADPCDTTTTTVPVPTDTTPPTTIDPSIPTTVAPPSSEVPAVPVDTVTVPTVEVAEVPAPPPAEAPATETTTTIAEATIAEPQASSGVEGEIAPVDASTPNPPLPPTNPSWTSQGVPRFVLPSIPGSSALQPGRTPAGERVVLAENVDVILATIRQLESSNRYDIGPNKALASGAYQYIPRTWNNYGGYAEAYLAPPEVQDERARADVERFLRMYGGNVAMVPVMWYYPRAAIEPLWMDRVPNPAGGNRLTIREYQTLWLEKLNANASAMLGTYVATPETPAALSVVSAIPTPTTTVPVDPSTADATTTPTTAAPTTTVPPTTAPPTTVPPTTVPPTTVPPATVPPAAVVPGAPATETSTTVAPTTTIPAPRIVSDEITVSELTMELATRSVPPDYEPTPDEGTARTIVFPVLGPVAYADGWMDSRDGGRRRHEGTDIIGVQMQPILAAVDGEITRLRTESLGISGVAITIRDREGWRYNYFHENNDTPGTDDGQASDAFRLAPGLAVGSKVVAGQIIGYMGDSGNAEDSVSHLHFEFRNPNGSASPSFWSLKAAEARQACTIGIGPWSTPSLSDQAEAAEMAQTTEATAAAEAAFVTPNALVAAAGAPGATDGSGAEHLVEHTVVTPLFGEGQWVIDSDGRVTATGDAALILPRRDLQCDPGPATPFGTDAAGWRAITSDIVDGTVLEGADLHRTILANVVPEPEPPATDPAVPTDPAALTGPAVPTDPAALTGPAVPASPAGSTVAAIPTRADAPTPTPAPGKVVAPLAPATRNSTRTSGGLWPTAAGKAPAASPLPTTPSTPTVEKAGAKVDPASVDPASVDAAGVEETESIGEPLAFVDTATGETIIVRFERPLRPQLPNRPPR